MTQRSKWWMAAGSVLVLVIACRSGGGAQRSMPDGVETGAVLNAIMIEGQKPMAPPEGMKVLEVRGSWVRIEIPPEVDTERWINFERVAACTIR